MYVHVIINFYIQMFMLSSTQLNPYQAIIHFGLGYGKWMDVDTSHVLFLIVTADTISTPPHPQPWASFNHHLKRSFCQHTSLFIINPLRMLKNYPITI